MVKAKYSYETVKTVNSSNNKYNNIYGVIRKYQEQGVHIRDETWDSIKVDFSATFDAILPHVKPGNIIRIHRLMTTESRQFRCIKVGDILLFSSFKDKDAATYKVRFEAKEPTIEVSDFARVAELEKWLANKLMEVSLKTMTLTTWYDLVCQVVDIKDLAPHRVVLIVYDGTNPGVKLNWVSPGFEQYDDMDSEKLVCVTAWDRHAAKARKLEKGSFIAIFNLQVTQNKLQLGIYELHLRGGTHYGKMIRNVHPNSYLGVNFKSRLDQLEGKKNQEAQSNKLNKPTTVIEEIEEGTSSENPSHSTQIVGDTGGMELYNISDIGSSMSESSDTSPPKDEQQPVKLVETETFPKSENTVKKMKVTCQVEFPINIDIEIPENCMNIRDYMSTNTDEMVNIKAKVISYKPVTRNINEFIKMVCPNCNYKESPSISVIHSIRKSSAPRTKIPCPDCQELKETHYLNATFWVYLFLKDTENYEIPATLNKLDLIKLLGVKVIPVLNSLEEANKILDFLDFICPSMTHGEDPFALIDDEMRPYLKWTIQRQPTSSRVKWEYRIITVQRL